MRSAVCGFRSASSTRFGSIASVRGSTSTRIGRAPTCSMTFTLAAKVIGVVITASPGPIPKALSATCNAAVHELSPSAAGAVTRLANCSFELLYFLGPVVIHSDRSVCTTASISASLNCVR